MKLTKNEEEMLREILNSYNEHGVENTEFYNLYSCSNKNLDERKIKRAIFGSLKRKKIVRHTDQRGFFNPIFPGERFKEALAEIGVYDLPEDAKNYL